MSRYIDCVIGEMVVRRETKRVTLEYLPHCKSRLLSHQSDQPSGLSRVGIVEPVGFFHETNNGTQYWEYLVSGLATSAYLQGFVMAHFASGFGEYKNFLSVNCECTALYLV